ncbi:MAG: pyruvate kinase [Candidatus Thermoplasmatota archaeon]
MRRTKILATLGPASTSEPTLRALIEAGMDAVRLNFSHGSQQEHEDVFQRVRSVSESMGRHVPIVQDIQGPKIRIGKLPQPIPLASGQQVRFHVGEEQKEPGVLPITYAHLAEDVKPGDRILMDDGYLSARVLAIEGKETVLAAIEDGGLLKAGKGVNFPGVRLSIRFPTEKDKLDLHFGQRLGVDYVAASFVRSAADISRVRAELDDDVGTRIIAKVELREAVENLEEIIKASDGVMVARGDLGVEMPAEDVPLIQKDILLRCDRLGIPSITATQMLESMIENPRPTRAEVNDVFNAVLDGTGALMLSGETAIGKHPAAAVATMGRIAQKAEHEFLSRASLHERRRTVTSRSTPDVVAHAAARGAEELGASAIVALTHHGLTARVLSKYKPTVPIFAVTSRPDTARRLGLLWGVRGVVAPFKNDEWEALASARDAIMQTGSLKNDDTVIVVSSRGGVRAQTNTMRVLRLGDIG